MLKVKRQRLARISQGDILRDVEHIESVRDEGPDLVVSRIIFPLVVVLTQDCDLEQDYHVRWSTSQSADHDKQLLSVLVAPVYNYDHVVNGEHLHELGLTMGRLKSSDMKKRAKTNQLARYHYLEFPLGIPVVDSILDFKHYFSVNVEVLKKLKRNNFVCRISELYREALSQRFAAFLSRIGLP